MRGLFVNTHLSSVYRGEESIKARHIFSWICWLVAPIGRTPIKDRCNMCANHHYLSFCLCISVNYDIKSAKVIKTRRLWFYLFKHFTIYSHYWPSVLRWIVKVTVHKLQVIIHDVLNRFVIAFLFFVLITGKHTNFFQKWIFNKNLT